MFDSVFHLLGFQRYPIGMRIVLVRRINVLRTFGAIGCATAGVERRQVHEGWMEKLMISSDSSLLKIRPCI